MHRKRLCEWNLFKKKGKQDSETLFLLGHDSQEQHERRLDEVKQLLRQVIRVGDSLEGLVMVDALQRLAIDYHFEKEIEVLLQRQLPMSATGSHHAHTGGLYESGLRFRLLRQAGYHVPSGV